MSANREDLTISDFLFARYAEIEEVARQATPGPWEARKVSGPRIGHDEAEVVHVSPVPDRGYYRLGMDRLDGQNARHIARHDPAHALADIEAKRRIVELHGESFSWMDSPTAPARDICSLCGTDDVTYPCQTLRALASVYADHPDYRQEWAL